MCSILNNYFVRPYPNFLILYVPYTKNQAIKKWLPYELICAAYLKNIATMNIVQLNPNLLTFLVQYTENQAVKNWLLFEIICAVYLEYIVNI